MNTLHLDKLFSEYENEIKAFIRLKVKDSDLSNDLLQDTFLKAQLNINQVGDHEKIKQWLYSIARNLVTDHFRKQKIRNSKLATFSSEAEGPHVESEMTNCISPMISKLPSVYREALTEVEINGTDQKTLAEKLNISYSGAKSRVQRAREMLKTNLLECCKITADKYGNIISHSPKSACTGC